MNIKKLRELKKNKKGFTLIEIIVVVVILAVLMAVAVPSVLKYMNEADNAKYMSQARGQMIVTQEELAKSYVHATDKKTWTAAPTELVTGSPTVSAVVVSSTEAKVTDAGVVSDETALVQGESPDDIAAYVVYFGGTGDAAKAVAVIVPNGSVSVGVR